MGIDVFEVRCVAKLVLYALYTRTYLLQVDAGGFVVIANKHSVFATMTPAHMGCIIVQVGFAMTVFYNLLVWITLLRQQAASIIVLHAVFGHAGHGFCKV